MRFTHKAERVRLTHHKVVAPTKFDMISYYNNGGIPVGFRFHPTDEELVGFYLYGRIITPPPDPREEDLRIIRELDLYRHEPWDLSEVCKIPGDHSANQNNWYFFSHKDKKYPTGNRANRATKAGFWKATGRDKCIQTPGAVGMRKTLVFYGGRAPHGQKTDWIMHEFRLDVDGNQHLLPNSASSLSSSSCDHDGAGAWVVCRVFRKTKNLKSKGDNDDTPTTSVEEDHQMALLPEITDSAEKFSSDEGGHVDYPPADHQMHHFSTSYNSMQHCKLELLSSNDSTVQHRHGALVRSDGNQLHANSGPLFQTSSSSTITTPNCNTFLDPTSTVLFEHQMMAQVGCCSSSSAGQQSSSSAAGLFSALPISSYLAILEENLPRTNNRGMAYRSSPAMLDGLEDFRFGNPVPPLDQSLTDVVTRPLGRLQQQLKHAEELLSSTPSHDPAPFGMPWVPSSTSGSQFLEFCHDSEVRTTFSPSGDRQH